MQLNGLPNGWTQVVTISSSTSASIVVTSGATLGYTTTLDVTFGFSASTPHFPSSNKITLTSLDGLTYGALTTNKAAFYSAAAGEVITITSAEYTAIQGISGSSVTGISNINATQTNSTTGLRVILPSSNPVIPANKSLIAFAVSVLAAPHTMSLWQSTGFNTSATATKFATTPSVSTSGVNYYVIKTPSPVTAQRSIGIATLTGSHAANSASTGGQYYANGTIGSLTSISIDRFLANQPIDIFQGIVR
jgi:hypothetical protein